MSDEVKETSVVEDSTQDASGGQSDILTLSKADLEKMFSERLKDFVPKKDYAGITKKLQDTLKSKEELTKSIMSKEELLAEENRTLKQNLQKAQLEKYGSKYDLPEELWPSYKEDDTPEDLENKFSIVQKKLKSEAEKELAKMMKQGSKAAKTSIAEPKKEFNAEDVKKRFEYLKKNLHRMSKEEKIKADQEIKQLTGVL